MEEKINDYGLLFESIVIKVFGIPKTSIYFSNYLNINNENKYILFTICIYILNYQEVTIDEKIILKDYLSDKKYLDDNQYYNMLKFLGEKFNII